MGDGWRLAGCSSSPTVLFAFSSLYQAASGSSRAWRGWREHRWGLESSYLAGVAITHAVASWLDRFPAGPMWGLWGVILGSLQLPWVSPFLLQPLQSAGSVGSTFLPGGPYGLGLRCFARPGPFLWSPISSWGEGHCGCIVSFQDPSLLHHQAASQASACGLLEEWARLSLRPLSIPGDTGQTL